MGTRTVYIRSPLGARQRSPLGMFLGNVVQFMEIITVPLFMLDGETYTVTGDLFGAVQGAGTLEVMDAPDGSGVVVDQTTIVSWADDEIVFTYDATGLPDDGLLWIRVTTDTAETDTAPTQAGQILDPISFSATSWGQAEYFCDLSGIYCTFTFSPTNVETVGYSNDVAINMQFRFFLNSPGFYLIGETSGNVVEFGPVQSIVDESLGAYGHWCNPPDGLIAFSAGDTLRILYEEGSCTGTHGWSTGETVYCIPKYPASIQILSPLPEDAFAQGDDVVFTGAAFAQEGDISESIEWYLMDGSTTETTLYDTGSTTTFSAVAEGFLVVARVTNQDGQTRFVPGYFSVNVQVVEVGDIFPLVANEDGGQVLHIYGSMFTVDTEVEIDGTPATGVTFYSSSHISCIVPAGTGTVDVIAINDIYASEPSVQLTYGTDENISVTSVDVASGSTAGGTAVEVTGTGFTADCTVYFGHWESGYEQAVSVTFVSDTAIECETPEWFEGAGDVDIIVLDEVTNAGGILVDGFEYT